MKKNLFILLQNLHIRNMYMPTQLGVFVEKSGAMLSVLKPWYVTGLADGDGMFGCIISKTNKTISLEFKITALSSTSYELINELKTFFNCGRISIDNREDGTIKYVVTDLKSILTCIIPHFEKYPLQGSKNLNFLTFKEIALMVENKEHLTEKGFNTILEKYKTMNSNRSFSEKYEYLLNKNFSLNKDWLIGFIESEGTFYCYMSKIEEKNQAFLASEDNIAIPKVYNSLEIAQSTHEVPLLKAIINFVEKGYLKPKPKSESLEDMLSLRSVSRIVFNSPDFIISFLGENPLFSSKQKDYTIWRDYLTLSKNKTHHTKDGIKKMLELKTSMNKK